MITPIFLPGLRILILLVFFVLLVWGGYRVALAAQETVEVRRKIRMVRVKDSLAVVTGGEARSAWLRLVELVETSGLSLTDSNPDALRSKMISAGFEAPEAPRIYVLVRLLMVVAVPLAGVLLLVVLGQEVSMVSLYFVAVLSAAIALLGPTIYLRQRIEARRTALVNGFPNCLDLLLVCVEAGLGLEAALDRIAREMADAEPEVTRLLVRTTLHLRAGASREEALRRLGELAGVDEIKSFSALLIQSERLGSSISSTLRIFASEMREKRRMRAQEKAHKLPVLISIPLITCMLPVMLGVLMLPAVIRVVNDLLPALMGG